MLTQDKPKLQLSTHEPLPGAINPSRQITQDDVLYLRDYTIAAAVISADKGVFGTHLQFKASDISNIGMSDDGSTVWYEINHAAGIPINIEVFHFHRQQLGLELQQPEVEQPEVEHQHTEPREHQLEAVSCPHCGGDGCGYCGYLGLKAHNSICWDVWNVIHEFDFRFSHCDETGSSIYDVYNITSGGWIGQLRRHRNEDEFWENSPDTYHWFTLYPATDSARFLSPYSAAAQMQRLGRRVFSQRQLAAALLAA